jgi:hypothetical protein
LCCQTYLLDIIRLPDFLLNFLKVIFYARNWVWAEMEVTIGFLFLFQNPHHKTATLDVTKPLCMIS